MRIKVNDYSSSKFSQKGNLYYDTKKDVLYYKENGSLKEMPNQKRNVKKLERVLSTHDDDSDVRLREKERGLLTHLQKTVKRISSSKSRKTKKKFFGLF